MQPFVDFLLRHLPEASSNADIEQLLGYVADHLGYRSGFMLDFPATGADRVHLWDSNPQRSAWWRQHTDDGWRSMSRELGKLLSDDGVHHFEIAEDDPRHAYAVQYDFSSTTVVPITFDGQLRGIASFSGEDVLPEDEAASLHIACYMILLQARTLVASTVVVPGSVALTPRERQVMELSAQGMTSDMVAQQLGMSPRTVNQHVDNVSGKLRTKNRVQTVAEAIRRGLLA